MVVSYCTHFVDMQFYPQSDLVLVIKVGPGVNPVILLVIDGRSPGRNRDG